MVFNAVDAMPKGGNLILMAEDVGDSVVISVGDTGTGTAPEVKSRIFDPFFTTKGKAGLGLGLAVSFGIIRRHGGNIEVESKYGIGTEFRITLPVAKIVEQSVKPSECIVPVLPEEPTTISEPTLPQLSTRLLVVDDEDFVRDLLREILEGENCDVTVAESGSEALTLFRE